MSDYWKSVPRKFCDICKCWFADNRASIEFHEKGKRHQENVQKKINEIQKKGLKEYKAKQQLENEMQKIEKAALEAFKKDIKQNPDLTGQAIAKNLSAAAKNKETKVCEPVKKKPKSVKSEPVPDKNSSVETSQQSEAKVWYEGVSEEGYTYYWNSVTSESQWEPPEEGYVSLQEQNAEYEAATGSEPSVHTQNETEELKLEEEEECTEAEEKDVKKEVAVTNTCGPQPKPDPYGQWVAVEKKEEEYVDLQLPKKPEGIEEVHIPVPKEDKLKIKEKTVGHLSEDYGESESTFKKRKNLGNAKRNVRQRLDDES